MRSALRKIWSRYSIEKEHCLYLARVERPVKRKDGSIAKKPAIFYQCEICHRYEKLEGVQVDHIDPVGTTPEPNDYKSWSLWLAKLFAPYSRLRCVCSPCHKRITKDQRNGSNVSYKRKIQ